MQGAATHQKPICGHPESCPEECQVVLVPTARHNVWVSLQPCLSRIRLSAFSITSAQGNLKYPACSHSANTGHYFLGFFGKGDDSIVAVQIQRGIQYPLQA